MERIYVSTFITGTEGIIKERLTDGLKPSKVVRTGEGIVFYQSDCAPAEAAALSYFNNTFILLARFTEKGLTFEKAIDEVCSVNFMKAYFPSDEARTFRVIFSDENTLVSVKDFYRNKIELNLSRRVHLRLNKSKPDTEFWFLRRSEGLLLFMQRLTMNTARAKRGQKGRLKPELAELMCYLAGVGPSDIVCDPFAGYGAIPDALAAGYRPRRVFCSDISEELTEALRKKWGANKRYTVVNAEVERLERAVGRGTVDKIITDPPWGAFDRSVDTVALYQRTAAAFAALLKEGGRAVVLTGRDIDMKRLLADTASLKLARKYEILVNGKKATINVISKTGGSN